MSKFICGNDVVENNRQGMEDFEAMIDSVKDEDAQKWLEEHKDLYVTEEK